MFSAVSTMLPWTTSSDNSMITHATVILSFPIK